jgi:hypothetical protein
MKKTKLGRFNKYIKPERGPLSVTPEGKRAGIARRKVELMRDQALLKSQVEDALYPL